MPQIPIYKQSQALATGPLSKGADVGAFTAPGRAAAQFGETAGQIAFQFGMAEKKAETDAAFTKLKTQYIDEVNEFQRNDKSTSTTEYQTNFKNFNDKFEKNYTALNLTGNQLRDIKGQMSLLVSNAQQTGKQTAFNRGRDEASRFNNNLLNNYLREISKLPKEGPLRGAMIKEAENLIEDAYLKGETKFLSINSKKALSSQIKQNDIMLLSDTTDSLDKLSEIEEETLNDFDMSAEMRTGVINKINTKQSTILTSLVGTVSEAIFKAEDDLFRRKELDDAIKLIKDGKDLSVYQKVDDKFVKVNFGKIPAKYKDQFINKLETEFTRRQDKKFNDTYVGLQADIQNKSLSELQTLKSNIQANKTFKQFQDRGKRNSLIALVESEIRDKAPRVISEANSSIDELKAKISITGEVTSEDDQTYDKNYNKLIQAEQFKEAENFKKTYTSLKIGFNSFKDIEFENKIKTAEMRSILAKKVKDEPTVSNKAALDIFDKLNGERKKAIETNPVGYYLQKKGKSISEVTVDELIQFQKGQDILFTNIRVTTDAELEVFETKYQNAQTYSEKAKTLNDFVRSKGIEHEDKILRHLMASGKISLADNFLASFPGAKSKSVFIANAPENVKRYQSEVPKSNRDAASAEISSLFTDYTNSYLGGTGASDVLGGGFTKGRSTFILGMRELVVNTANFYMDTGLAKTPEEAAEKAFDDVITANYNLTNKINDGVVRFDKSIDEVTATEYTNMLSISLLRNVDYLKRVVKPPPPPQGLDAAGVAKHNEDYYQDLASKGSWRTSNNNKGVYLVDASGNIVERKDFFVGPGDTQQPFVSIQFSTMGEALQKYREIVKTTPAIYGQGTKLLEYFNQSGHLF